MSDRDPLTIAAQHLREGRAEKAVPLLEAEKAKHPDDAGVLHLLGIALGQLGKFTTALPMLQRAAELLPNEASVHNNLGNTLAGTDHDAEAVEAFDRALELQPEHAMAWRNRGAALRRLGRLSDAIDSFDRALAIDPNFVDALTGKSEALEVLGRRQESVELLKQAIEAGGDEPSLRYALAMLDAEPVPGAMPPEFVRKLFDGYADQFDRHLVDKLKYRGPTLMDEAIQAVGLGTGMDVVDLGCGTGLCGPLLRPRARRLVGVDLSARMLDKARERGDYDLLEEAEIVAWLQGRSREFDLAVAADVVLYLGDLSGLFAALANALRPGGCFVFSVESWDGEGAFGLKGTGRFGHSAQLLRETAATAGLEVVRLEDRVLRREGPDDVDGHVAVLRVPKA